MILPATTKVSSSGSEVQRVGSGNTCLVLQGQLCQLQAGTLTARSCTILRATTAVFDLALLHKNNSQQLRVFPEHWGMSPPAPRLVRDSRPHKTSAATKPASVSNCSSAASTTEPKGFLQWFPHSQFITLQHKLCGCPSWHFLGLSAWYWITSSKESCFIDVCSPPSKCCT